MNLTTAKNRSALTGRSTTVVELCQTEPVKRPKYISGVRVRSIGAHSMRKVVAATLSHSLPVARRRRRSVTTALAAMAAASKVSDAARTGPGVDDPPATQERME